MRKMSSLNCWIILSTSAFLILLLSNKACSQEATGSLQDEEASNSKRSSWNNVGAAWGKRGWKDMQGNWGKRGWDKMNGAWGKRDTPEEAAAAELEEVWNGMEKRPEWGKLKGSWGKRAAVGGWNNLKGLWGKRSWGKLSKSWGKRSDSPMDYEPLVEAY